MIVLVDRRGLIPYQHAHRRQMALIKQLHESNRQEDICLIMQHPPVFTLGRHGTMDNVLVTKSFLRQKNIELIRIERGGQVTFHGPGQIVCYPIFNLRRNRLGVVDFVHGLEQVMLGVLKRFGLNADRNRKNHGIWVDDHKLGSVGIAVRHGISYHGLALNVQLDLEPFSWINPCGLTEVSISSMAQELGRSVSVEDVAGAMVEEVGQTFACKVKPMRAGSAVNRKKNAARRTAKPKWLRQRLPKGSGYERTRRLVRQNDLRTVCQEARCPNQFECFGRGTATFLLMGKSCTRNCRFCAVPHTGAQPLDPEEPARIARAVADLRLQYVVLTSVTRDDLSDGGAAHFGRTMEAIRARCQKTGIEVLIPDFQGNRAALEMLCSHLPTVLNHNMETVAALYRRVRPQAIYDRSLQLLRRVKEINSHIMTKSGLMLGLGESEEELIDTMIDIRAAGCDLLTLGQYLQPTRDNVGVHRYVPPKEFDALRKKALALGFSGVAAGPHVRSSYQAGELCAPAA